MQSSMQSNGQNNPDPLWRQLLAKAGLLEEIEMAVLPSMPLSISKVELIERSLAGVTQLGQLVELRILGVNGRKRTDSGYFDAPDKLAKAAARYDSKAEGLYFTLNPVNPALIARANNRVKEYAEHTTSDNDIVRRINLPIDFDPVRPAGISSTDAEKQAAMPRAWACRAWLTKQGWSEPVFADSGNGAHLIYAIDLPNDAESNELIKGCLAALAYLFSDDLVSIDASISNASRIFKLYGTLACKGDNTPERPHRRASILSMPDKRDVVSAEHLKTLALLKPQPEKSNVKKSMPNPRGEQAAYARTALQSEIATLSATREKRNNQLFKSSAALFELVAGGVLDRTTVYGALLDAAQAIGLPENEARKTIESGEKHGISAPRTIPEREDENQDDHGQKRSDTPNGQTIAQRSQSKPDQAADRARQYLMHVDALDDLPPISWLIQDMLPANSLIEIHGAPGVGKTQVIFDMAQTLAASGKDVIYVVAEGLQGYRGRKRAWQKFRKQPGGNLFILQGAVQLCESKAVRTFIDLIKSKNPALVVFDTLSRCSLGADENNQKDMGFILESLDIVRRETGAAVAVVHHTNAAGSRERGSSVIRGGMDVMIEVSKEDDLIVVSCSKMKDAEEFAPVYLKPVLVDIGEVKPVPVLIPAERRTQTQADKLTPLQYHILKTIGMDMFVESGIKSSQLDELLPSNTKRTSKYYSLNTLIRLGYVKPHAKGDPYRITDEGRQKLSNAESDAITAKSNVSKASPSLYIWTLPEACPMSSPNPHTNRCGLDETLDIADVQEKSDNLTHSDESSDPDTEVAIEPMPEHEIKYYAALAGVAYPTTDGTELYQIVSFIPKRQRDAFEMAIGEAVAAYYHEIAQRGCEPPVASIPNEILEKYLQPGLVSTSELYKGYEQATQAGCGTQFRQELQHRNEKADDVLAQLLAGRRFSTTVFVPHCSKRQR